MNAFDERFPGTTTLVWKQNWKVLHKKISEYKIGNILNIGLGPGNSCLDWNKFLSKIFSVKYIENLEIDDGIYNAAAKNEDVLLKYVRLGDVRELDKLYLPNSFDLVFWSHGPEHIERHEWRDTFKKIELVAEKVVVIQMPWGGAYNGDIGHLSESIQKGEIEKYGYSVSYDGEVDTKNAGILGYKIL